METTDRDNDAMILTSDAIGGIIKNVIELNEPTINKILLIIATEMLILLFLTSWLIKMCYNLFNGFQIKFATNLEKKKENTKLIDNS